MQTLRSKPAFVLCVLLVLVGLQLRALVLQVRAGFRPFRHAPSRVAFSWDMFATRIERCDLQWSQGIRTRYGVIHRMHQLGRRFEWDVVQDTVNDYENVAMYLCGFATRRPAAVSLRCAMPEGREELIDFDCP